MVEKKKKIAKFEMSFKHVQSGGRADSCQESIPAKAQRDREQVGVEGPEVLRLKVFRARQSSRGLFGEVGGF